MPALTEHQSQLSGRILNMADSGAGKTGALACLAEAGYRLIIADYDNGLDILVGLLDGNEEAKKRVFFETFSDELQMVNGMILPKGVPKAWTQSMEGLTKWRFPKEPGSKEYYDLGNIGTWGPDTVFIIDSYGFQGMAALSFVRQVRQHQMENFIRIEDYGEAMRLVEGVLQLIKSPHIKCNIIVNTHVAYMEDAARGTLRGLPRALGSKLSPNVPGYFNTVISGTTEGRGAAAKRIIRTQSEGGMELKVPLKRGVLPDVLPQEDGLLTIIKKLQSRTPDMVPDDEKDEEN